jgi:hypothetical protein
MAAKLKSSGKKGGGKAPGSAEAPPHYYGHRERLRTRFREAGSDALTDYELLEIVLFRSNLRRDVKPLCTTTSWSARKVMRASRASS